MFYFLLDVLIFVKQHTRKTSIKRRVPNKRRVSNKRRGFEAHVLINAGSRLNAGSQINARGSSRNTELSKYQATSHTL